MFRVRASRAEKKKEVCCTEISWFVFVDNDIALLELKECYVALIYNLVLIRFPLIVVLC